MAFLTAISYSADALAANCTVDVSPTASCDNLSITTNNLTINIPAGTYGGGDAISLANQSSGLDLTISQGAIVGSNSVYGLRLYNGSINSITNLGSMSSMSSMYAGINNDGTIGTLNNLQDNLIFRGALPTNYNIIIGTGATATTGFGKIQFNSETGTTTFGISLLSGSNIGVTGTRYQNVISSLASANITNEDTLLTYTNGQATATYKLVVDDGNVADTWDLLIESMSNGPSATDTQSSLKTLAPRLRGSFNSVSAMANFSNTYDCNLFDVKGMCISAGGRITTIDNPSSHHSAAVVVLGHKISPHIRIGGFLDQSVNNNNPTGINISNKNPMMGVFAYWNQNADGLGYQVKIANAYQDKDLSTTRDVIGTSEAGRGRTDLNTQSYVGELSYAFNYQDSTIVRPYFAVRHTSIEQDAYTETGVTTPLTYSALNDKTTSALMGVKFKHALTPKTNLIGSLGLEQDLHNKTYRLIATGVSGLTSENFSGDIHRTRPVASLGATYDISKTQRLAGEVLVQQLPFQNTAGATAFFNYMIGF